MRILIFVAVAGFNTLVGIPPGWAQLTPATQSEAEAGAATEASNPPAVTPMASQSRLAGIGGVTPEKLQATASQRFDVLTRCYNNSRTGANVHESILNPTVVPTGLQRLFSLDVVADGSQDDPRIEAQTLIATGLMMGDGSLRDVAYVCTMADNVWAFDANTGVPLWPKPRNLGIPITPKPTPHPGFPSSTEIDLWGVNIRWGILSTPVIDRDARAMYVVSWVSPDGSVAHARFMMNKINLIDGSDIVPPQEITATFTAGGKTAVFTPANQKQRAALLLAPILGQMAALPTVSAPRSGSHMDMPGMRGMTEDVESPQPKVLIMACGMKGENNPDQHGWVIAFDTDTLKPTAAWCTTPTTFGGGIWQSGGGPAADDFGDIYVMTANGGFNGVTDFAESFVRLHYTPPVATGGQGSLTVVEHFTPYVDATRLASEPGTGYSFQDQDLGSSGPVVPRGVPFVFGAGKDGVSYVLTRGSFGNTTLEDLKNNKQFAALSAPPIFFTYFPGFGVDPMNVEDLDHNYFGLTHHLHSTPIYYNSPELGPTVYCWGENEHLRAWGMGKTGVLTYLAAGLETASNGSPIPLGGMPGGMLTLSAQRGQKHSAIVWATVPISGDGNKHVVAGIVRAYDATEFDQTPGGPVIRLLWQSNSVNFDYDKFCPPVVANGKVYVPTYDGRVDVYGLKQ